MMILSVKLSDTQKMGNLKPGATYTYEHQDGVTYASEAGSLSKQVHGWMYDKDHPSFDPRTSDGRPLHDHLMDSRMWGEIRRAARTNSTLQEAIERVIIIYHLSKDNGK
jgi:hypothetical protein